MLIKIFCSIPTSDLLQNVSRVSKNFHSLTKVTLAHQYVTLLDNSEKVSQFLATHKSIVFLNLMPSKKNQPNLETLSGQVLIGLNSQHRLSFVHISSKVSVNEESLILLLKNPKGKHLKKLKLKNYHNIDSAEITSNWTSNATNLKYLELCCSFTELQNDARSINASTLIEIGQASGQLEYFRFEGIIFNEIHLGPIFKANPNTLREVHLPHIRCSREDVLCLMACHQLDSLSIWLDGSNISKATLTKIPENKQLKSLNLRIDGVGSIHPKNVAELLVHPNLLHLLSLHLLSIDLNLSTTKVFRAIAGLPNLKYLHFAHNFQGTVIKLFEFLKMVNKLETLIWNVETNLMHEELKKVFFMDLPNLKFLKIANSGFLDFFQILRIMQQSPTIRGVHLGSYVCYKLPNQKYCFPEKFSAKLFSFRFPVAMEEMEKIDAFFQPNIFDQNNPNFPQQSVKEKIDFFVPMTIEIVMLSILTIFSMGMVIYNRY